MAIDPLWGNFEYEPRLCIEIIQMYSEGKTRSEFCAKYNLGEATFSQWKKRYPLFNKAVAVAHEHARAYYDKLRLNHLIEEHEGEKLNVALFNRMYNARFNVPAQRAVKVDKLANAKNEREMLIAINKAISKGELTPDEAQKLASLIDVSLKIKNINELEDRLKSIEDANLICANEDSV